MKHASINQSINFIHCLQKYMYTIKQQVALWVFHRNWNVPTHENQIWELATPNCYC